MTGLFDELMDEMASKFIVGTCQLLPKSHDPVSNFIHTFKLNQYFIPCGSSAEFYIRPLTPLIHDIDRLIVYTDVLAFREDIPILPADVSRLNDTIKCFKIVPYLEYPGFVRLQFFGEMNYNWRYKKFKFADLPNYYGRLDLHGFKSATLQGPSVKIQFDETYISQDNVFSVWCPQWPNAACGWPKRPRAYRWPTVAII